VTFDEMEAFCKQYYNIEDTDAAFKEWVVYCLTSVNTNFDDMCFYK